MYGMIRYWMRWGVLALLCLNYGVAQAEGLYIVGSSTVYPYAKLTVDELVTKKVIKPVRMEVTGTGKGLDIFCQSNALPSPDISNASHRITLQQLHKCTENGVKVTEMIMGYDGIVIAEARASRSMDLTSRDLFLALVAKVPDKQGSHLIDNPYHYWDEVDSSLPHRQIVIVGPPPQSGTYETLQARLITAQSRLFPVYHREGYGAYQSIRDDEVYINDHEHHEAFISVLLNNHDAIALFGQVPFLRHVHELQAIKLNGLLATKTSISAMTYPLARPLYFYIKDDHFDKKKDVRAYVNTLMSDEMIGDDGVCIQHGMIPLPESIKNAYRLWLRYGIPLTPTLLQNG